jgi:hypothetical protein
MRWLHNPVDCGPASLADRAVTAPSPARCSHAPGRTSELGRVLAPASDCPGAARGSRADRGVARGRAVDPREPVAVLVVGRERPARRQRRRARPRRLLLRHVRRACTRNEDRAGGPFPQGAVLLLHVVRRSRAAGRFGVRRADRSGPGERQSFSGSGSAARGRSLSPPGAVHPAARETGGQHAVREATGGLRRRAAVRDAGLRARRPVASRTLSEPDDRDGRRSRAGGARGVRDDLIDRGRGGWSACKRGG